MPAFGPYETVEEILSRPWVLVATARRAGEDGPPELVLKAPRPMPGIETPAEAEQRRRDLLQSAAVQEQVATQKHSRRWAQVREISSAASETYVVMDRYDRSAADLSRQRKLTRSELRTLSLAVLEGLEEIRSGCGRGHGRLSAANVLLRSKGGSVLGEIVLSDPAPEMSDKGTADLRDFGFLIRHLATGYEDRVGDPPDKAWAHLGGAASFWRNLAADLVRLEPEADAPDLAELVEKVTRKAPRERGWKLPAVAAVLVVLGLGVAGWLVFAWEAKVQLGELHDEWQLLCIEEDGWSEGLYTSLTAQQREVTRELDREDPLRQHIERRVREIDDLLKNFEDSIPADKQGRKDRQALAWDNRDVLLDLGEEGEVRPWNSLSPAEFQDGVHAAYRAIMLLKGALTDEGGEGVERWGLHQEFDRLTRIASEDTAWEGLGAFIEKIVERVSPESYLPASDSESQPARYEPRTAEKLAAAIVDAAAQEHRLVTLLAEWQEARSAIAELEQNAGEDPVLGGLGDLFKAEALGMPGNRVWDRNAVERVSGKMEEALVPLRLVRSYVEGAAWSKTDTRGLSVEAQGLVKDSGVTPEVLLAWMALAEDYRQLDGENPVDVLIAELEGKRARLESIVGDSPTPDAGVTELRSDIDGLVRELRDVNRPWITRYGPQVREVAATASPRVRAIEDRVGDFEIKPEAMLEMLANAEAPLGADGTPAVLRDFWELQRTSWIEGVRNGTLPPYKVKRSFEQLDGSLRQVAEMVPALTVPPDQAGFDRDRIATAVANERARSLQRALDVVGEDWELEAYTISEADSASLRQIVAEREAWLAASSALFGELASAAARLSAFEPLEGFDADGDSPREILSKWAGRAVYAELGGDESFSSLVDLVADLEEVGKADRSVLVGLVAARAAEPQRAYAAWRRLGEQRFLWPATAQEVEPAAGFVEAMMAVFESDTTLAARAEELRVAAAERWSLAVQAAMARGDWPGMETMFDASLRFGAAVGVQPEGVRLNAALYALKRSVESGDDVAAAAGLLSYREAVAGLTLSEQRVYDEVFREYENKAASGTNVEALRGAGPGAHGWVGELDQAGPDGRLGEVLRFRESSGLALEFRLIEEGTNPDRLVYLSTAEVSIGVAAWAFSRGRQSELNGVWPTLSNESWKGPRLWRIRGRNLIADSNRENWFAWTPRAEQVEEKFAPGVQTHEPVSAERFPIQHVSFAAAEILAGRLGCRLPTGDEWAAAALAGQKSAGGIVNLRDSSFAAQRDYVRQRTDTQLPYPDAGIYTPSGTAIGPDAVDGRGADNTLFFRGVGGVGGFENMVGNVAEWVDVNGEPGVIGGSALSETADTSTPGQLGRRGVSPKRRTYSDVGFRLALEFPGTLKPSLAQQIQDWFGNAETRYVSTAR